MEPNETKKYTLYEMRKLSKKSGADIAKRCGVSYKSLRNWESNATIPNIVNLTDLLQIYGFTLDQLDMSAFYEIMDDRVKKQEDDDEDENMPDRLRTKHKTTK